MKARVRGGVPAPPAPPSGYAPDRKIKKEFKKNRVPTWLCVFNQIVLFSLLTKLA